MKKFKFIASKADTETLLMCYANLEECENPIGCSRSMPNGDYLIRGDKQHHRKEYLCIENRWFYFGETTVDNGHVATRSAMYQLFPVLPEREYQYLERNFKKLNPLWRKNVEGWQSWHYLRRVMRIL